MSNTVKNLLCQNQLKIYIEYFKKNINKIMSISANCIKLKLFSNENFKQDLKNILYNIFEIILHISKINIKKIK